MATHQADGLYKLTPQMLAKAGACEEQLDAFKQYFGRRGVLVTHDAVVTARRKFGAHLFITAEFMRDAGRVTEDELRAFEQRYWGSAHRMADAFMDLLAARAKREGRL